MKNLLFITNSISFGGAAKMLCYVAESLALRGFSVCIVNLRTSNNVTDYERKLNDAVKVITLDNIPDKQQNYHRIKEIVKIGKAEESDVVIGFVHYPNMLAAIAGKLLHIPAIISERGDPTRNPDRSMKDKIKKYLINHAEGGVFQTDGAKVYYSKHMQEKGVVIPNPIFITGEVPYCPQEERDHTVVSVGRL